MQLYQKVKKVEKLFAIVEKNLKRFQDSSRLGCIPGCGLCCFKSNIEASVLEMLPFAYHLYRENKAVDFYEKLSLRPDEPVCMLLSPILYENQKGLCTNYNNRGLICRLFGFSAMLDKYHHPVLVTCKIIKENDPVNYQNVVNSISEGGYVPVISNYYQQMRNIDPDLGTNIQTINMSMKKAIEIVLSYYSYRRKPKHAG
jgi:Fe-S-cluster containining protein